MRVSNMNKVKAANLANLTIGSVMSVDEAVNAYFTNNPNVIIKYLSSAKDVKKLFGALELANYEIENDKLLSDSSRYGDIQAIIVDELVKPENVEFIEANIITKEEILGDNCPNLGLAAEKLNSVKQQTVGMELIR